MSMDFTQLKLGKKPPRHDRRTLQLARYLPPTLPPIPDTYAWGSAIVEFGTMMNDRLGDCAIAGAAHLVQVWTQAATGREVTIPDVEVVAAYGAITGYNPDDPTTDQGTDLLTVLNHWRKVGIGGHRIGAYAQLDLQNEALFRAAVYLFGGVYCGVALPLTAQNQPIWDVVGDALVGAAAPWSWGGHCVALIEYAGWGDTAVTWGIRMPMTAAFRQRYLDEAYAIISPDFLAGNADPHGCDVATLLEDLKAVTA